MANGSPVAPLGSLSLPLKFKDQLTYQNMVIADLEMQAVLGYDFMSKNHCILDINNQTILINDQTVFCKLESQLPNLFRISIDKDITIPARSEMIIQGKAVQNTLKGTRIIISSTTESLQHKGVLVAKSLCTTGQQGIPLRVIKVSDQPQTIFKNTLAATAESILDQDIFFEPGDDHPPNISLFEDMSEPVDPKSVPNCTGINECKQKGIFHFQIRHWPIKQAPRRLPMSQRKEVEGEILKMLDHGIISPSKSPWRRFFRCS